MTNDQPADAEAIVKLRGDPPRVMRLSRKAIGIGSAIALTLVGGALIYALQTDTRKANQELYNTQGTAVADGLASAPQDYSQVPRLGPPLPGDLGRPILDAQNRGSIAELPPIGTQQAPPPPQGISPQEATRQRMEQEREAARGSRLFFGGGSPATSLAQTDDDRTLAPSQVPQSGQQGSTPSFLEQTAERRTVSLHRLEAPPSVSLLQAGSIIPAALITGIRSDQPGLVTAQVTQNVYDSLTGHQLLIPQGARLIGDYASDVGFGQRRVSLAWNRLIFPDGRSIMLDRQPASDPAGFAGLEDGIDYHWGGVFKAALVSTLLGIGGELGSGNDSDIARALSRSGQDSVGRAGEQIVGRELNIRPTLTIRPGYPVRVLVTRDIILDGST